MKHLLLVDMEGALAKVDLVARQNNDNILLSIALDLLEPLAQALEARLVGEVKGENHALGAAVIGGGYGAEALLAGSVPDLDSGLVVIQLHLLLFLNS